MMSMKVTPAAARTMYEFLRTVAPISGWNLPEPEDIKFGIKRWKDGQWGEYEYDGEKRAIYVNANRIKTPLSLMGTMAHEMIHVYQETAGFDRDVTHGRAFKLLAQKLTAVLGVDVE